MKLLINNKYRTVYRFINFNTFIQFSFHFPRSQQFVITVDNTKGL